MMYILDLFIPYIQTGLWCVQRCMMTHVHQKNNCSDWREGRARLLVSSAYAPFRVPYFLNATFDFAVSHILLAVWIRDTKSLFLVLPGVAYLERHLKYKYGMCFART